MLILISFRDILITLLRMLMQYKGITMITSKVGKWKTTIQISTIILILIFLTMQAYNISTSNFMIDYHVVLFLMLLTTFVTFYTGIHYFYFNFKTIKKLFFQ
jgi:phosphatidylglycerophosphate synthase